MLKGMSRYHCSLSGTCEEAEEGTYESLSECEEKCTGSTEKEIDYLVWLMAEGDPLSIAPSDQIEMVRRLLGVQVPPRDAQHILEILWGYNDEADMFIDLFLRFSSIRPYLDDTDLKDELLETGRPEILEWYLRDNNSLDRRAIQTFLEAATLTPEIKDLLMYWYDPADMYEYMYEYHHWEDDAPLLVALSYLRAPEYQEWYEELMTDYREWLAENGLEDEWL
jgi:hypothetical protein